MAPYISDTIWQYLVSQHPELVSLGMRQSTGNAPALAGVDLHNLAMVATPSGLLVPGKISSKQENQPGSQPLSEVIQNYWVAEGKKLSPCTRTDYGLWYRRFQRFLNNDPFFSEITKHQIEAFMDQLDDIRRRDALEAAERAVEKRLRKMPVGDDKTEAETELLRREKERIDALPPLSQKTRLNCHISLAALWTYAWKSDLCQVHLLHKITPPEGDTLEVDAFTQAEFRSLLEVTAHSVAYNNRGRLTQKKLATTARGQAILYILLDTGVRASELCHIKIEEIRNHRIVVFGKGRKQRSIPLNELTEKVIAQYLDTRGSPKTGFLFTNEDGHGPMTRDALRQFMDDLGKRSGIRGVYSHRFRHTFAINFLRNGGNELELQMLLGHSTLEMVKRYARIAQSDLDIAHAKASPVKNWMEEHSA